MKGRDAATVAVLARNAGLTRLTERLLGSNRRIFALYPTWEALAEDPPSRGRVVLLVEDKLLDEPAAEEGLKSLADGRTLEIAALYARWDRSWLAGRLRAGVRHFYELGAPELPRQLLSLLAKLDEEQLGLEPHLAFGARPTVWPISASAEKEARLDELEARVQVATAHSGRLALLAREVGDELLLNALFHGPLDSASPAGAGDHVAVPPGSVRLAFGYDGHTLGVLVADAFGSLAPAVAAERLARTREDGPAPGAQAGLGLYSVFERVDHLVVNLVPGWSTEIVGLLDTERSGRGPVRRALDLYVYERG